MTTLKEFLAGESLRYKGFRRPCVATYMIGVGIVVVDAKSGVEQGLVAVTDDRSATRLYYNLTRKVQR